MIPYSIKAGQVLFKVHVVPGAASSEIAGVHNDSLRVRLAARPIEGAANKELILVLAKIFKVAKGNVTIVSGHRGRAKQVSIEGEPQNVVEVLSRSVAGDHGRE